VGQVFKFVWRLHWKINAVCMSLSPLVSFKSRFVTYLLNFPRRIPKILATSLSWSSVGYNWLIKRALGKAQTQISSEYTSQTHCDETISFPISLSVYYLPTGTLLTYFIWRPSLIIYYYYYYYNHCCIYIIPE